MITRTDIVKVKKQAPNYMPSVQKLPLIIVTLHRNKRVSKTLTIDICAYNIY